MQRDQEDTVDISEAVEMACAAIWDPQHEHDSFAKGRKWATAQELAKRDVLSYAGSVANTRWVAYTVIAASWEWLREYFYEEAKDSVAT